MTASLPASEKLPLWRLIAGTAVLGSLVAILLLLAPNYVRNFAFSAKVKSAVAANASQPEDAVRAAILTEATAFGLQVFPSEIKTSQTGGRLRVDVRYVVQKSLGPYHVDLHFHPSAQVPLSKSK